MRNKIKSAYKCSKDCESCEGKGYVVTGLEGFINRRMEQDVRDVYGPCENAEYIEPAYDDSEE